MMKDYTDITFILDESGSMGSMVEDVKGSFKTFIEDQQKVNGKCVFTLVKFSNSAIISDAQDIKNVKELSYFPSGGTALLDAIGNAILKAGQRFEGMNEDERPDKVIFVILTDGEENSSSEYNRSKIFDMISEQEKKYNWSFIYLGANQDAIAVGAQYNFGENRSMSFNGNGRSYSKVLHAVSSHVSSYRNSGNLSDLDFSLEDRENVVK